MKSLEVLKNINYKDVIVRALWTFAQTFTATFFLLAGVNKLACASWHELYALTLATALSAPDYLRLMKRRTKNEAPRLAVSVVTAMI